MIRLTREVVSALDRARDAGIERSEASVVGAVDGEAVARAVFECEIELAEFAAVCDFCLGADGGDELFAEVLRMLANMMMEGKRRMY